MKKMISKEIVFNQLKGKLVVSCQALQDEPLHGSDVMGKMAKAACVGGASGIRANSAVDIEAIKGYVDLPIIGLVKRDYPQSDVYITATRKEADELIGAGVDIIAIDATDRPRPNGESLESLIAYLKAKGQTIMADVSTFDEALKAVKLGVDCVSTTMSGYTPYSPQQCCPDFILLKRLVDTLQIPVFAEGRISTPEDVKRAMDIGAHAVVVGSAITRPQEITKKFVQSIQSRGEKQDEHTNGVQEQVRRIN
jgi:N-acylglucosamine-6-phosphate 2-epimerase